MDQRRRRGIKKSPGVRSQSRVDARASQLSFRQLAKLKSARVAPHSPREQLPARRYSSLKGFKIKTPGKKLFSLAANVPLETLVSTNPIRCAVYSWLGGNWELKLRRRKRLTICFGVFQECSDASLVTLINTLTGWCHVWVTSFTRLLAAGVERT